MVSVIAKNLKDRRQLKAINEIFEKADISGNGKISLQEYINICGEYGIEVSPSELKKVEAIADSSGEIPKSDFIAYVQKSNLFKSFEEVDPESDFHWNRKVDLAWNLFDKNMDGYITKIEFRWMTSSDKLNRQQIDMVYKKCDLNGDGVLDKEEFKKMIFRHRARKENFKLEEEEAAEIQVKKKPRLPIYKPLQEPTLSTSQKSSIEDIAPMEHQEPMDIPTDEDIAEELDNFDNYTDQAVIPEELEGVQYKSKQYKY